MQKQRAGRVRPASHQSLRLWRIVTVLQYRHDVARKGISPILPRLWSHERQATSRLRCLAANWLPVTPGTRGLPYSKLGHCLSLSTVTGSNRVLHQISATEPELNRPDFHARRQIQREFRPCASRIWRHNGPAFPLQNTQISCGLYYATLLTIARGSSAVTMPFKVSTSARIVSRPVASLTMAFLPPRSM
jgi:hypothetical protein